MEIKEYLKDNEWVCTDIYFEDYTIGLHGYLHVNFKQKGLGSWGMMTDASYGAIKFFENGIKDTDFEDYGDLFYTYKDDVWSMYSKTSSKD